MDDWRSIATSNYSAVGALVQRHWRSAISRAYYAVYARMVAELKKAGAAFPTGQEGPSHAKLPGMIESHLKYAGDIRWRLSGLITRLYNLRVIADYRPSDNVADGEARYAAVMMQQVFGLMRRIDNGHANV
jgi:uncharacterized protein (UPF0332 family)